jgi:Tol biopolymer transport system component
MRRILPLLLTAWIGSACNSGTALLSRTPAASGAEALAGRDAGFPGVVTRRVWSGLWKTAPYLYTAVPTPDQTRLLFTEWDPPAIGVMNLATGERSRVGRLTPKEVEEGLYVDYPLLSPDGRSVAYVVSEPGTRPQGRLVIGKAEIRVATLDGTGVRVVADISEGRSFDLWDWSPDGSQFALNQYNDDDSSALVLVSARDGSKRVLKSFSWSDGVYRARFSPDGKFIAYVAPAPEGTGKGDVFVIAVDGSREVRLSRSGAAGHETEVLGWSPAGDAVLYWRWDENDFSSVWRVPLTPDLAVGEPQLVRGGLHGHLDPFRMVGDRLYYGMGGLGGAFGMQQVLEISVDLEKGVALGPPTTLVGRVSHFFDAAWSPDGMWIAYTDGQTGIVLRSAATGEERKLQRPQGFSLKGWSDDGRSLLLRGGLPIHGPRDYRLDIGTGALEPIGQPPTNPTVMSVAVANGSTIYEVRTSPSLPDWSPTPEGTLIARDTVTKRERSLYEGRVYRLQVSPDGTQLAMQTSGPSGRNSIAVLPTAGGAVRTVYEERPGEQLRLGALRWSPDGRHLLFFVDNEGELPFSIMSVPADGGEARALYTTTDMPRMPSGPLSIHPDGRRILFSGHGEMNPSKEVWVMENLSPPVAVSSRPR